MKKKLTAILVVMLLSFILVLPAGAAETATLYVEYPYTGTWFEVYHMATADASGKYVATEDFADCPVAFGSVENPVAASQADVLESYVRLWELEPAAADQIDWNQKAFFYGLEPGLYLVISRNLITGGKTYRAQPLCQPLPVLDSGTLSYTHTLSPKAVLVTTDTQERGARKVIKVWDDNGTDEPHPDAVTIYLLCDGELYDTQLLNAGNNWTYQWKNLDSTCEWTLVEEPVPEYTVQIEKTGITYVLTNTRIPGEIPPATEDPAEPTTEPTEEPTEEPTIPPAAEPPGSSADGAGADPTLPQTGMLWWPVPLLAAAGMVLFVLGWALNRREEDAA